MGDPQPVVDLILGASVDAVRRADLP